jgi:MFS superfamily sulfate permease-like transporter
MKNILSTWRTDLSSGVVVFLVALPLCLGIALASGAPLFSGIVAGVIGGIVVGFISNSAVGVSGPAAGLASIVMAAITELGGEKGGFELLLTSILIAGVLQIILGAVKLGFIANYVPNSVIKGMLAAIGIIIILKQIPHGLGYDKDPEGDLGLSQPDGHNTFSEIWYSLESPTVSAICITLISIILLIIWERKFIQNTFLKQVPVQLLVVLIGILLTYMFIGTSWELIEEHRVNVGTKGKEFTELFTFPNFNGFKNFNVWKYGIIIAIVASIETLLSVEASEKLDPKNRQTNSNLELIAQGFGNSASALIGGLPVTQVVVRTSANVNSGGLNKTSTIFHGILIAIAVLSIPTFLNYIPYAALAAILFIVGYKLAKPKLFIEMYQSGWNEFIPFIITIFTIVFTDLLIGISVGLVIAFLWRIVFKKTQIS